MNIGFKAHYFKEMAELEAGNFWFRVRNKLILWALHKYSPELKSFLEIGYRTGLSPTEKLIQPKAEIPGFRSRRIARRALLA